ncbi:MAG: CrcB protein [Gammaproteobacteria bacterium]|jgi:CrcB protein
MAQVLAIACGGAVGALLRFFLAGAVNNWAGPSFPFGTLSVNIIGSMLMGFAFVIFGERVQVSPEVRLGIMVGVLGAFTTFSTFSIETLGLLQTGAVLKGLINAGASVLLCVAACWGGVALAHLFVSSRP